MNESFKWFATVDLSEYEDKYISIVGTEVVFADEDPEIAYEEAKKSILIRKLSSGRFYQVILLSSGEGNIMIEFSYRCEVLPSGITIYRPVAKVYIHKTNGDWIPEYFYVDSGADYTLVPYRMGRFLGLESISVLDITEMGGIGGVIGVRTAVVPMKIGEYEFDCTIMWAQIERVPLLLGRQDVFEYFEITFRQRTKKVIFKWNS